MQLPDERVDLVLACLRRRHAPADTADLRARLLTDPAAMDGLLHAASRRMITAAVIDGLERHGIVHPAPSDRAGPATLRADLWRLRREHEARRDVQASALRDIVEALNAEGIVPLVFKGAASLLSGIPAWRSQRDLDFAVAPREADRTMRVLRSLGYRVQKAMSARHHHDHSMIRDDPPVAVEPHRRLNGPRAARLLGDVPMIDRAVDHSFGRLRVRLLRPEDALLHGMVHHHVENRGAHFGVISLKGLIEFCEALGGLDGDATRRLALALHGRARLRAATELWIAACHRWLDPDVALPVQPSEAAIRRLRKMEVRMLTPDPARIGEAAAEEIRGILGVSGPRRPLVAAGAALEVASNRVLARRHRATKAAGIVNLSEAVTDGPEADHRTGRPE